MFNVRGMTSMNAAEYIYKTELHMHTEPASSCGHVFPEEAVRLYAEKGYHSLVICNHFSYKLLLQGDKKETIETYLDDIRRAKEAAKEYDINIILGCEVRVEENVNDYLLFGIDEEDLSFIYDYLDKPFEEFSKAFRSEDKLIIQAHPFRDGMTMVNPDLLDGIEVFNMHPRHNSRNGLSARYAKEHPFIVTAGTDFHRVQDVGLSAMLTKTEMKTSHDIVMALKEGNYIFEIGENIVIPKRMK